METITVGELLANEEKYFSSGDYILRYINPNGTLVPFRKCHLKADASTNVFKIFRFGSVRQENIE